ncbi:hypothetical protein Tco_1447623 [Tanacetum coccineum]
MRIAYDSERVKGPNAAVAFMANLSSHYATNNPVNEEMHTPEEHLDSDADTEMMTIHPVSSYRLATEDPNFTNEKELSGDQVYWLSANEIASQASKPATPAHLIVHKSRNLQSSSGHLQKANAVFSSNWKIFDELEADCYDQQALETDKIQFKDTMHSLRRILTHVTAYTEKLSALTAGNNQLKAQVTGKTSKWRTFKTSETPKYFAPECTKLSSKVMCDDSVNLKPTRHKRLNVQPKKDGKTQFTDHKLSDRKAGSKGISGSINCSWYLILDAQDIDQQDRCRTQKRPSMQTVRFVRTDNEKPEFVEYYTRTDGLRVFGILMKQSVPSVSQQQTSLFERRTELMEAALYYAHLWRKLHSFLWAEAVATACSTLNDLMFRFSVAYPTNNYDDVGKLNAKADIGIFVGYAPTKKAPRTSTYDFCANSTELELTAYSQSSRSALVKDPENHLVSPSYKETAYCKNETMVHLPDGRENTPPQTRTEMKVSMITSSPKSQRPLLSTNPYMPGIILKKLGLRLQHTIDTPEAERPNLDEDRRES